MSVNERMDRLLAKARKEPDVKDALLQTQAEREPMEAFCRLAGDYGYPVLPGELLAAGEEYCSNLHKSVNGGATYPLDGWDDLLELFYAALRLIP